MKLHRVIVKLNLEHQEGYSEPGLDNILGAIVKLDLITSDYNITVNRLVHSIIITYLFRSSSDG